MEVLNVHREAKRIARDAKSNKVGSGLSWKTEDLEGGNESADVIKASIGGDL
jgi:hypothetical protein